MIGSTALPNAWSVAAGIINPVTGRWITKSWNIDRLLPEAIRTYRAIEAQFGIQVYHPQAVRRYCQNNAGVKLSGRRIRNPRYANVLGEYSPPGAGPEAIVDAHGSFEILQGGYVDLPKLIQTLHKHFNKQGNLTDDGFEHAQLKHGQGGWEYQEFEATHVIFCEGTGITENPWFRDLPLTPAKGETLILHSETLKLPPCIYHSSKWLLPYGAQRFRIGATYDDTDLDPSPTEAGKNELLSDAHDMLNGDHLLEVEAHLSGLRPSTRDARPFLGEHSTERGLYVLNGLGSKGASVGPEMSRQLLGHIFDDEALDPETNITRFQ